MNRQDAFDSDPRPCAFDWCATEHGRTVHPDDEDHRSGGVAVSLRTRAATARDRGHLEEWEIGLIRRSADAETWLVVEAPRGVSIALSREATRALVDAVCADRHLRDFVGGRPSGA
ncbi:hypothetical protein ACFZA2_04155 [Microbacterium sp. NPDC007973]|uniref:hypothetical protein n=1 Tax=Microbacterium sp. NPDC007973 TaxID=3364182 RepID=UPI0036F1622A